MKKSDIINLNEKRFVLREKSDVLGDTIDTTRTVAEEIERLRAMGAMEAADRLESSCDDGEDKGIYLEISPVKTVDEEGKLLRFDFRAIKRELVAEIIGEV